ncbi:hypothetical protein BJ970_004982 [Saccharopolyspora phatthalungensis]|uniref:Uncharacterized protein n=1 Tax=Saccharopolyspora phatthalungensis TaxID=664693 RepID=A0A840QFF5_9PSEU|nr:hypothetical protein [Saccharopolyspora phatthalungensis]
MDGEPVPGGSCWGLAVAPPPDVSFRLAGKPVWDTSGSLSARAEQHLRSLAGVAL